MLLFFIGKLLLLVLVVKEKEKKGRRLVGFVVDINKMFLIYSAEEYDRVNDNIDLVIVLVEWELEKRVEKMDIFFVDLGKGKRFNFKWYLNSSYCIF